MDKARGIELYFQLCRKLWNEVAGRHSEKWSNSQVKHECFLNGYFLMEQSKMLCKFSACPPAFIQAMIKRLWYKRTLKSCLTSVLSLTWKKQNKTGPVCFKSEHVKEPHCHGHITLPLQDDIGNSTVLWINEVVSTAVEGEPNFHEESDWLIWTFYSTLPLAQGALQ